MVEDKFNAFLKCAIANLQVQGTLPEVTYDRSEAEREREIERESQRERQKDRAKQRAGKSERAGDTFF